MNPILNLEKIGKEIAVNVDNNIESKFFVQRLESSDYLILTSSQGHYIVGLKIK